jgi:hypothetical protein
MMRSRRGAAIAAVLSAICMSSLGPSRAAAQNGVLLQGIVDGELWSTSKTSNLLTRNSGNPAGLGRLQLWGAYQPFQSLIVYAQGQAESGAAAAEPGSEVYTDQFGVRYIASRAWVLDAGRVTPIIGMFSARHFSTRNPLIGEPDGYSADYPLGIKLTGEVGRFDYRTGVLNLPTVHAGYEPTPTPRLRPAIGAGYTPFVGFRLGGSFTVGSYLDRSTPASALGGRAWSDYQQRLGAIDLEYARGYLETHVEGARGSYDIPGGSPVSGFTYYGEAKYTFTPRFFAAVRVERNKYPFIHNGGTSVWTARLTDFVDGESGIGYRVAASTILKASYRADRWWVRPNSGFRGTGGGAFAMQVSQAFDVMDWVDRARNR